MIAISAHTKLYLAKDATDMRKSFRGLIPLTEAVLQEEPVSGHLFVFLNRRQDLMKILYWDGTGFCTWYKRLERGSFQRPPAVAGEERPGLELSTAQLSLILEGIDLTSVRQRLRFQRFSAKSTASVTRRTSKGRQKRVLDASIPCDPAALDAGPGRHRAAAGRAHAGAGDAILGAGDR
jgi:transposase